MITIFVGTAIRCGDCCHVSSPLKHRYRLTKSLLWIRRENKNIRFAGTHVVSVHRIFSERFDKLIFQRHERIVVRQDGRRELKHKLILHGGFGSNETELSDRRRQRALP
jgi:hypothetical protein